MKTIYTPSGVRLRQYASRPGDINWLFLPGGPGIGSESLIELVHVLDVPGTLWLVDLPGDGNNRQPPGMAEDPYSGWPDVLTEAAKALPNVVITGHSTGGMYLLSVPALEKEIIGMALLDTAPDASWHQAFITMATQHPLSEVDRATAYYEANPQDENIAAIAIASAEWNFTAEGVDAGRELLARMPYNGAAIAWSAANFDTVYRATWWPHTLPVLVLAGSEDRIVTQAGWSQAHFQTPNVFWRTIPGAGHFPWNENPTDVRKAFNNFSKKIVL